jgi:hypothetical protein
MPRSSSRTGPRAGGTRSPHERLTQQSWGSLQGCHILLAMKPSLLRRLMCLREMGSPTRTGASALTAAAGTCLLLSVGTPNACVDVHDVETTASNTWSDPTIVRRDNLAVVGALEVTDPNVKGTVSSPYLSDGQWTGLSGHVSIEEIREHYWSYAVQDSPILPGRAFKGPGEAYFGTRAGTMVHGNTYAVSLHAEDKGGDSFNLQNIRFVKLADDVLVVPVVVMSWKKPGFDPAFSNQFYRAQNMFDFNPIFVGPLHAYWRPDNTKVIPLPLGATYPLYPAIVDTPALDFFTYLQPDRDELPPDEIWTECGIQFQVVAQFIGLLPEGWNNACNSNALNYGQPEWEVQAQMASYPLLRDYLVNDLRPIYVSYGDGSNCQSGFGVSFNGSTPGKANHVEVGATHRPRNITSHELGHALSLDHEVYFDAQGNEQGVAGNLMAPSPKGEETKITGAQCQAARSAAAGYSARFDAFNKATGRTYSDKPAPPPSGTVGGDDGGEITPGTSNEICCTGDKDVKLAAPGSCPGKEVDITKCEGVCCSDGAAESRYLCEKSGKKVVPCQLK